MTWITLAAKIVEMVLSLIDQFNKGTLSQERLDLVVLALREPPEPKKEAS